MGALIRTRVGWLLILCVVLLEITSLETIDSCHMFVQTRNISIRLLAAQNLALVRLRILKTVVLRPLTAMKRVRLLAVLGVTMLDGVGRLRTMVKSHMIVQTRTSYIRL